MRKNGAHEVSLTWLSPVSMSKEGCRHDSYLSKQKLWHRAMSYQYRNFNIVQKNYFQFHWNWEQPLGGSK